MNAVCLRFRALIVTALGLFLFFTACQFTGGGGYVAGESARQSASKSMNDSVGRADAVSRNETQPAEVDDAVYKAKLIALANGDTTGRWPVTDQPPPLPGAVLPYNRIIAFYGNLYSTRMGILGELAPDEMLAKLDEEVANWRAADTAIEPIPALHYIAVTAQGSPGRDGKYRARMPFSQIDSVLRIAEKRDALVFLDIQVGFSTLQAELPRLDTFLRMPHVHLGIDPEFSMKDSLPPGKRIGHFTAADINFAATHLAELVRTSSLPPKVLVVHRFTQGMVKNYDEIKLRPEVQLLIHMDGWGAPVLKKDTYRRYVSNEPVQFTGFKFFYKNDLKPAPHRMMTLAEVLALTPKPIYIQYQ